MTVIALLNNYSFPLLLSDMLLSLERMSGASKNAYLPILGDMNAVEKYLGKTLSFEPTRLVRKKYIVNRHLHIAWAGDVLAGIRLRQHLLTLEDGTRTVEEIILDAVSQLPTDQQRGLSVIAMRLPIDAVHEHLSKSIEVYAHNCITYESNFWGKCYFGGSGANELKEWIALRDESWSKAFANDHDQLMPERLCARLIFNESLMLTEGNRTRFADLFESGCGGFYEVSRFISGGLVVPRNTVHLNLRMNHDGTISLTRFFLYHTCLPAPDSARIAVISSLVSSPIELDIQGEQTGFTCQDADILVCHPFWLKEISEGQTHVRTNSPIEYFSELQISIEAVTVNIFHEDTQ